MAEDKRPSNPRPDPQPRPVRESEIIERGRTTPDRPIPPPTSGGQRGESE